MTPPTHPDPTSSVQADAERRVRQQTIMADLSRLVLAGAPLERVFGEAAERTAAILEAPLLSICAHEPEAACVRLVAGVGWRPGRVGTATLPAGPATAAGDALRATEPVFVSDVSTQTVAVPDLFAEHGVRSGIGVQIGGAGAPYGILGLHHTRTDAFTEADRVFVVSVALLLEAAVRRDRAQATIRQHVARLEEQAATLEARVAERTRQVRSLSADLTLAEQRERARVAQVLHDDLQQLLFALQMKVQLVERAVAGGGDAVAPLHDTQALIDRAIETTRTLTVDLSPPVLAGEGIDRSLEWLAVRMEDGYGLRTAVHAHGDTRASAAVQTLLFQLVRELLFNVVKHSGRLAAEVTVRRLDGHVRIDVADAGSGFDPAGLEPGGFGLFSVRERLGQIGGAMRVASRPSGGTTVTIEAPVDP